MLERFRDSDEPFLTAVWSNLCFATFAVPPELLRDRVPEPLELETRDGDAFVSLVAFDFEETKVWKVGWPGFRAFPEVNLRFHVRYGDHRGVMFIRELVPQPFVAWLAGVFYHEPYESTPMESHVHRHDGTLEVRHEWTYGGSIHRFRMRAHDEPALPDDDSDEARFTQPRYGFGTNAEGEPIAYEVQHPDWETYPVESCKIDVDWGQVYGRDWSVLDDRGPIALALARGSEIEVHSKLSLDELED